MDNKEKKDIMHEGFNQYTHDFLVRRFEQITFEQITIEEALSSNITAVDMIKKVVNNYED